MFLSNIALASAALMGMAVADWTGTLRHEDVTKIPIFCGDGTVILGGLPSDAEYEEVCTSVNTCVASSTP